ncbi:hypothetical protein C5167_024153 [Papaver somniferum]|uniref:CRIB domain-containing protein n=1 Tax=Papaver somniferum TaxID=3469 RepID=A0A4Y7JR22_PAPSO|nr:CRIB domain-containing protein RIC7-like [Papaver somniferum]RZC62401.1 hypothetical protein C5167_024153 [Papaver somniferum]
MKGILKGLRYISQIFENDYEEEEEEEMQIGCPTDVQHVAHIGVEGPAVANPSWMNGKKSEASESASKAKNKKGEANTKSKAKNASQDLSQEGTDLPQSTQDISEVAKPSRNRRHSTSVTLNSSETQELEVPKKSSRRGHSLDLTEQKKSSATKKSKDHSSSSNEGLDAPSIPKSSRKKKLKESPSTVGVAATSKDRRKGSKESNSLSTSNVQVPGPASEPANKTNSSELSQEDLDDDLKLEEKGF